MINKIKTVLGVFKSNPVLIAAAVGGALIGAYTFKVAKKLFGTKSVVDAVKQSSSSIKVDSPMVHITVDGVTVGTSVNGEMVYGHGKNAEEASHDLLTKVMQYVYYK